MQKQLMTMCCLFFMIVGQLMAQQIEPWSFDMSGSSIGVPRYFPTRLTNTDGAPQTLRGYMCTGYADVDMVLLRASDSSSADGHFFLPGEEMDLFVMVTPKSQAPMTLGCNLQVEDTNGVMSFGGSLSLYGTSAKQGIVKSVAPTADFGNIGAGTGTSTTIVLKNTGNGVAHYKAIEEPSLPFSIADNRIWIVNPSDSVVITVVFEPTTTGEFSDTVVFGHAYIYTPSPVRVMLRGSSGAAAPGLVALTPIVNVNEVQTGAESTVAIAFVASSSGAQVLSASLRDGVAFSIASIASLPVSVSPGDTLVVGVLFSPNSVGTFSDVLTLTMAEGPIVQVVLNGTAIVSGVTESASLCNVHPNPAIGTVHWCSEAQDVWLVINTVGSVVATVSSDDQGRCAWSANSSGTYALRNVRSGEMLRVLVLK